MTWPSKPCPRTEHLHDDLQTVWVDCARHGRTRAAMKGGLDNRCSECVGEMLGQWKLVRPEPFPKPSMNIFYLRYRYKDFGNE